MKKIFVIFGLCFFGVSTNVKADNDYPTQHCIDKIQSGTVYNGWSDNDKLYTKQSNKWYTFQADSDYCLDKTTVCSLGTELTGSENNGTNAIYGKKTCAISHVGQSDNWFDHKAPITFSDCTDKKWQRNDSISKTNEVMVINSKAILSANNYPMQYWVHWYSKPTYPNVCVGYYCKGADGKYTEPCNDGTCDASCSSNTTTLPKGKGTSDKKVNHDAHIDIVTPYLDALKSKFDTLTI